MTLAELEEFCRVKASEGWSRLMVSEHCGFSRHTFRQLTADFKPIDWPKNGKSIRNFECNGARRGKMSPRLAVAVSAARLARINGSPKHTIGEHTGTVAQLYGIWGVYSSTSRDGVKRRIARGWPLLDAFFAPSGTGNPNSTHRRRVDQNDHHPG